MDITLHCVDGADLKTKGLNEVCPSICKFNQISHCAATRRIAGKFNLRKYRSTLLTCTC